MNSKDESFMMSGSIIKRTFVNAVQVVEDILGCTLFKSGHFHVGKTNFNGKANGIGILFFPFCGFIFSDFQEDKCNGLSLIKFPNNDYMIANFSKGILNGISYIYDYGIKETIIINFREGKIINEIKKQSCLLNYENFPEIFDKINFFEQKFINLFENKKILKIIRAEKSWTIGSFLKGKLDGLGLIISSNFKIQLGHFTKGELNGHGRTIDNNGDVKVGIFHKGKPERDVLVFNNKKKIWFSFDRFSKRLIPIQSNNGGCFPMPGFNISSFSFFLDLKVKKMNKILSEDFFSLNKEILKKEIFFNFKQNFRS